jgi:hypothetical protein
MDSDQKNHFYLACVAALFAVISVAMWYLVPYFSEKRSAEERVQVQRMQETWTEMCASGELPPEACDEEPLEEPPVLSDEELAS